MSLFTGPICMLIRGNSCDLERTISMRCGSAESSTGDYGLQLLLGLSASDLNLIQHYQMALGILTGLLRGGRLVPRSGYTALTSKRGPKGFYKGKGCKSTGRHTSKGGYILMAEKLPQFVVPDLTDFKLKAYVAHNTPKVPKMEKTSEEATASAS
ncbi:hypothetical protein R1sor_010886 [Riccia sorocarpa]|uniref:Mitochondrial ribosomal protein L27 n=1 Tax=Riccia sorocarpa TaxID=122646 RepID=A0ABD3HZA6_9MARC